MKKDLEQIFRAHGGQLRMSEAIALGITRYMLYSLRDRGAIERVTRGVYRLAELPPIPPVTQTPERGVQSNKVFQPGMKLRRQSVVLNHLMRFGWAHISCRRLKNHNSFFAFSAEAPNAQRIKDAMGL